MRFTLFLLAAAAASAAAQCADEASGLGDFAAWQAAQTGPVATVPAGAALLVGAGAPATLWVEGTLRVEGSVVFARAGA